MLRDCGSNITRTVAVVRDQPAPVVNNNIEIINQLRQENQDLKIMISQLAQKIDGIKPVNGGY